MTICLNSLYPQIKPMERIRLLMAADSRKDDVEYQRLFNASPIRTWYFSEHMLAEQAIHVLTLTYITEQLDAAASAFMALFQLSHHPDPDHTMEFIADTSAYFFSVNSQAWNLFCQEIQLPPKELVRANYQGWLLEVCERQLTQHAPTSEELQRYPLLQRPLVSAKDLAARWRQQLERILQTMPSDHHDPLS